jgi:hypothetical protein
VIVGEIPCAPRRVLETVCQQCHSSPPRNGAPFPLVTYNDVHQTLDNRPIAYWMEAAASAGEMPLPPVTIANHDRDTLLKWLRAGAPARGPQDSCDAGTPPIEEEDAAAEPPSVP